MAATVLLFDIGEVRRKWGWFLALGIVMIVFGMIALAIMPAATIGTVLILGWLMILEADGSEGRTDEWGNPDREPDREQGTPGHGQRKSDCGSNRRDSSRIDSHQLRSPDVLTVRANRIA